MEQSVPVITYHTIGFHTESRPWSFLSLSASIFERQMAWLKKSGYHTITLSELYDYRTKGKQIPKKSVVLNFDDGFLDNWVVAADILKYYGFIATVYVSTDFVDKRGIIRKQIPLKSYTNRIKLSDWWGYASWDELRAMEADGSFDVQGHAKTHTWYPMYDEIIDFFKPGDKYYWLWWNQFPERKALWLTEYSEQDVPYGYPIMKYGKSLSGRRFIVSQEVVDFAIEFVKARGLDCLNEVGKNDLRSIIQTKFGKECGTYETENEYIQRLEDEIINSKTEIERNLNKKIEFLAFPGGGQNETSRRMIFDAGYLAVSGKTSRTNFPSQDTSQFNRVGGWSGLLVKGQALPLFEMQYLRMQIARGEGKRTLFVGALSIAGKIRRQLGDRKRASRGDISGFKQ